MLPNIVIGKKEKKSCFSWRGTLTTKINKIWTMGEVVNLEKATNILKLFKQLLSPNILQLCNEKQQKR